MTLFLCALCDQEITEQNASEEHIIPNSIGGPAFCKTVESSGIIEGKRLT